MANIKTYSPLRYPGGKNKLSTYVQKLIESNRLNGCTYIEPYSGGAAVALYLLIEGIVDNIIINDYDRSIYAFWYSVLNYTDELCAMIEETNITIDNWYIQREIQLDKANANLLTLGFSTLFLNRTNRSGIMKAGVIGGIKQDGEYKLDCRFNKTEIINKVRQIAAHRQNIRLYNLDTLLLIQDIIIEINNPCFVFFDPPYYNKGSQLYVNYYNHGDHLLLSTEIELLPDNVHWIVTYDNVKEIQEMYRKFRTTQYGLKYSAGKKYTGYEIMVYSGNLTIDDECKNICN